MFTVKNAVTSKRDLYSDVESNNLRKYLLGGGYAFGDNQYGGGWVYEPSVLLQYTEETQEKIVDVNMKVYKYMDFGKIWAGLSYRRSLDGISYTKGGKSKSQYMQYFSPFIGVNYKSVMISYTYSHVMGDIVFEKGGYHQFGIGFNLFGKKSPLDCNCPTVKD
jgi:hypothetical protein